MNDNQHAVYSAIQHSIYDSGVLEKLIEAVDKATHEVTRPFVLLQPKVYKDGNQWCALYGANGEGVVGFGNTPEEAAKAFDKAWKEGA